MFFAKFNLIGVFMKIFSIFSLFFTYSILACPNLAGQYANCISQTGDNSNTTDVTITQITEAKVTTYTITATDSISGETEQKIMIADGKTRTTSETDPATGLTFKESQSFSCKNNVLFGKMLITFNNSEMLNVNLETNKVDGIVQIKMKGSSMDQPIDDLVICK
jgi:hypothetical protein